MKKAICVLPLCVLMLTGCTLFHKHTWTAATCTEPATCSECGETEGEPLGHKWAAATCEKPKTCSVCGETEGEALGHKWVEATCKAPKTCSVCGKTEGDKAPHTWVEATLEKPKTCSVCGATEGDRLHDRSEYFSFELGKYAIMLLPPNSVGGLQFNWIQKYIGPKVIKYYTLRFELKNGVGDPAYDDITNKSKFEMKIEGPVEPNGYVTAMSKDDPWLYCDMAQEMDITTVELEFTDGERVTVQYDMALKEMETGSWDTYVLWLKEAVPEWWAQNIQE